jgi:hypothetical protein
MLVVLEAIAGPIAGRKIEVRSSSIMRLGRTSKSDYAIGEDSYLSGQHFAVECDGTQCRVRDLGSSNGTFVNGDRITERIVHEGDSLVAGGSTFSIHVQASAASAATASATVPATRTKTAPSPTFTGSHTRVDHTPHGVNPAGVTPAGVATEGRPEWPGFSRAQSLLLSELYRTGDNVYAVLDASRDSRIPAFVDAAIDPDGRVPAYVVALPPQARLLDVLVKDGWNRGWGFYCVTGSSIEEVCAHWRRYLVLRTEDGKALTFRFWDPRVLRALTPVMPAGEAADFFGPVTRMIVESEKAEMAVELSLSPRGGRQQTLVLI